MSNSYTYTIMLCPIVGKSDAIDLTSLGNAISTSRDDGNLTVTVEIASDSFNSLTTKRLDVDLCPEGQTCGCEWNVDNLHWSVANYNLCWPDVTWTNPNANCLLRKIQLRSLRILAPFRYEHGLGPNEPISSIYPDGDSRNPDCVACGISGVAESFNTGPNVDPGDDFSLWGYFRDAACGDEDTAVALAPSIYFETDGYVGGTILSYTEDDGIKTYSINIKGGVVPVKAVDMYEPSVGDWVTLAKLNCEPRSFSERFTEPLTDTNVCTTSSYKIVSYGIGIGLGCE